MPGMRSPAQQAREQPVEYATKVDFQVLAAEIRGFRESVEAELRAQREATDVRFEKVEVELRTQRETMVTELRAQRETMEAELRAQREATDVRFEKVEAELRAQREATDVRFEKVEAELRAQREIMEARFEKAEGLLERQHELIRMLASQIDQVNARIDRVDVRLDQRDARFDSLLKWGVGVLVAVVVGFGGLILAPHASSLRAAEPRRRCTRSGHDLRRGRSEQGRLPSSPSPARAEGGLRAEPDIWQVRAVGCRP